MSLLRVTWEVTQWERSDLAWEGEPGKKGSNYVARECLCCWGAEEAKTEGEGRKKKGKEGDHHSAVCLWRRKREMKKGGWENEREDRHSSLHSFPPSSISQDWRCEVPAQTQPKATPWSLIVIGQEPSILTSDTQAHIWRGTASQHIRPFIFGPLCLSFRYPQVDLALESADMICLVFL